MFLRSCDLALTLNRHERVWVKHHSNIGSLTILRYARKLAHCVGFAARMRLNTHPACKVYNFSMPAELGVALDALLKAYHLVPVPSPDSLADIIESYFDDEEDESVDSPAIREPIPSSTTIQPLLSAVIRCLYTELAPLKIDRKNPYFSVAARFLILSCFSVTGAFCPSNIATQHIAALTWSGRITMHNILLQLLDDDMTLSEYVLSPLLTFTI